MTGSVRMTANLLKIPEPTVAMWKKTEWWNDVVKEVSTQENLTLNNKLKKLIDKSLDLVGDRLEHGDFIYDQKTGQIKRKPVVLRDVHRVAVDLISQKERIKMSENMVVAEENIMQRLEKLNKSFEEFANKQAEKAPVVVTDIIYSDSSVTTTDVMFVQEDNDEGEDSALYEEGPQDGEISSGL
jgi:hypothetical protein